ncbi:MAG: hypothetical protein A2086_13455 [Spirochaetes bacterium GWD1_27_9]|nr:MAG: hypothetical protein A2Z98_02755 [Spirochaetes bacterium GWB1_27_13]OHD23101.1 MAG: hypothetical protein A2Y34_16940 [Spirochaetes bacterium GWC1_27_15]OHD39913.1 MAG: hypothetical protein A2086_13455 [Spirochaetes bacterium GWD1_27_9]
MDYQNFFSSAVNRMKSSKIRELMKYASMPNVVSFGGGKPDPENFPFNDVEDIINNWDAKKVEAAMQYGNTAGYLPLINKLKERMKVKKHINTDNQDIIVTTGGQQGLYLISKIFVDPNDVVIVEEPSFVGATASFLSNGAKIVSVPLLKDGVDVDALESLIIKLKNEGEKIKFFYTIPTFQNPAGITLSQEKRKKIYEISKKYDLIILEDDPYSDLYFEGTDNDYLPIKAIGNDAPIIYLGTFSKIFCPGFRLAWIVADKKIIEKAGLAKQSIDACSSSFGQVVAYDYLELEFIDKYLIKMREVYKAKKELMIKCIKQYFPQEVKCTNPTGGFFIYVDLPQNISSELLFKKTIEKEVAFVTGEPFHTIEEEKDRHLRMSFSSSSNEEIEKGIKIIGECLKEMLKS